MSRRILIAVAIVLVVIGILMDSSLFIVDQTETALVVQLGQPRRVIRDPGLELKKPFIEDVVLYDKRLLDFEPPPEEVIVSDQKRIVVDSYSRYRIVDPLLFYQTVGTEAGVRSRLAAKFSAPTTACALPFAARAAAARITSRASPTFPAWSSPPFAMWTKTS